MSPPMGLATSITEELGRSIVRGRLGPADLLPTEQDLTVQFGVSRTVVREAMKALSGKGLLESRPSRGARVRNREQWTPLDGDILQWMEKDERFYRELLELRRIVEVPAAELACERATPADLLAMDSALEEMVRAESEKRHARFKEADRELHRAVVRACHNRLIEQLLQVLEPFLDISFDANLHLLSFVPTAKLHQKLVNAIRIRSARGARISMQRIIRQAWADVYRPHPGRTTSRHPSTEKA